MREVTKDEFFAKIGPMNVHLRSEREETIWETPQREIIGRSTPGYVDTGIVPKRWFLAGHYAA
jgi:hypothetical protein